MSASLALEKQVFIFLYISNSEKPFLISYLNCRSVSKENVSRFNIAVAIVLQQGFWRARRREFNQRWADLGSHRNGSPSLTWSTTAWGQSLVLQHLRSSASPVSCFSVVLLPLLFTGNFIEARFLPEFHRTIFKRTERIFPFSLFITHPPNPLSKTDFTSEFLAKRVLLSHPETLPWERGFSPHPPPFGIVAQCNSF